MDKQTYYINITIYPYQLDRIIELLRQENIHGWVYIPLKGDSNG